MNLYKIVRWYQPARIVLSLLGLLCLYGCGQRSDKTESAEDSTANTAATKITQPDTLCFRQITSRDSTTLQLVIRDSTVTGALKVLSFEKDRAQGSIQGTLHNNQIVADWQRSGEGVTQAYEVIFALKGDAVTWREGERIEKQGRWVLKNSEQGYTYVLMKTACP